MSEVIEDFAEPLLEGADTPDEFRKALTIAMIAWNYSLLDEAARAEPDPTRAELMADPLVRDMFEALIERKRQLYPDNRRAILDFQLIPNGTSHQFNVVSTLG